MVSDNVPAASFGDSGRALLNKKIKEQPSNYVTMSSHKIHSVKLVLLFSSGPFVLVVEETEPSNDPSVRCKLPPNGRSRSNVLWESVGEFFPAQKKGGRPTREKVAIHVAEKEIQIPHKSGTVQIILRVLDL